MNKAHPWIWGLLYLASIVLGNLFVNWFGIVHYAGLVFPAGVVFVGLTFSFRDFVQRNWGDAATWIWMLVATGITLLFNWEIALASCTAFLVSEGVDWFAFRVLKVPFHKRIYLSNLFSTPLDSLIFVTIAFGFNWPAIWGQAVIKYASGLLVLPFLMWRRRANAIKL